jgi:hypothetical protein
MVKQMKKTLKKASKDVKSEGVLSSKTLNNVAQIINKMTVLRRLVSGTAINSPTNPETFDSFVSASNTYLNNVESQIRKTKAKAISDVLMLTEFKSNDLEAIANVASSYTDVRVGALVDQARIDHEVLKLAFDDQEVQELASQEAQLHVSDRNYNTETARRIHLLSEAAMSSLERLNLTGNVCGRTVHCHTLQNWNIDGYDNGLQFGIKGTTSNGAGGVAAAALWSDTINLANYVVNPFGVPYSPNPAFEIEVQTYDKNGYGDFPPKQDIYDWFIDLALQLDISDAAALTTTLGGSEIDLSIVTFDQTLAPIKTKTFKVELQTGATSRSTTLHLRLPCATNTGDDMKVYCAFDVVLQSTLAVAIDDVDVTIEKPRLVGIPKSDWAEAANVDYIDVDGNRQVLDITTKWLDVLGEVMHDPHKDPNFSIESIWSRKGDNDDDLPSLCDALIGYSETRWGVGGPSVSDKYLGYGSDFSKLGRIASYLFVDGPFSGVDRHDVMHVLNMLENDIRDFPKYLDMNESFSRKASAELYSSYY